MRRKTAMNEFSIQRTLNELFTNVSSTIYHVDKQYAHFTIELSDHERVVTMTRLYGLFIAIEFEITIGTSFTFLHVYACRYPLQLSRYRIAFESSKCGQSDAVI